MNSESDALTMVGIGFGPANLSLAAALEERQDCLQGSNHSYLFVEQKPDFAWHPGMLLPGARVQLSFLKDLVTLRNPRSRFSFLCYLQHVGRLDRFVNRRTFFPTRHEFNGYYRWVAEQLRQNVCYGSRAVRIAPWQPDHHSAVELLEVEIEDVGSGRRQCLLTRNVVLAPGGTPLIPPGVPRSQHGRVLHSGGFLSTLPEHFPNRLEPYRFLIVGSGQTAAEVFQYLLREYPNAQVTVAFRRLAFKPADDSHFVNEIYFPEMVDFFYGLPPERRKTLLTVHLDTNYSAVDNDLIRELYEELYEQTVSGRSRGLILNLRELLQVEEGPRSVQAHLRSLVDDREERLEADCLVLATGFERERRPALLDELSPHLHIDEEGGYRVTRSFRVEAEPSFRPGVFLQGFSERTHGLSDTLLSTLAVRAREILAALEVEEPALVTASQ